MIFEQKGSRRLQIRACNQIINQSVKPIKRTLQHAINIQTSGLKRQKSYHHLAKEGRNEMVIKKQSKREQFEGIRKHLSR